MGVNMSKTNNKGVSSLDNILLVIDDDLVNQHRFTQALHADGTVFIERFSGVSSIIKKRSFAVVLLTQSDEKAIDVIKELNILASCTKVLVIVDNDINRTLLLLNMGAFGIISRPFNDDILRLMVRRCAHVYKIENELERLKSYERREGSIVGENPQMIQLIKMLDSVAMSNANVLIIGESGTGKALCARAIHERSQRSNKPFISVNCALLPEYLLDHELFGTDNASAHHTGKIELANGGTLFLDDIDELPTTLQEKIFYFAKNRIIQSVIQHSELKVNVKIISATRKDLIPAVSSKRFREDLYKLLSEIPILIPPLRERRDDVLLLAKRFLLQFNPTMKRNISGFTDDAVESLIAHGWGGNVRELQNKIQSAVILTDGPLISAADLMLTRGQIRDSGLPLDLRKVREEAEKQVVMRALVKAKGNMSQTAHLLGISRPTLYILITKYSLQR